MEIKKTTNYLIDWNDISSEDTMDKIHYFSMLRKLLLEIEKVPMAFEVLNKFNVYFIDVDEIPRVNIDEPVEERKKI
jgi:hypothetical protein